jgi:hypothetical protein
MFAPPCASGACLSLAVLGRQLRLGQVYTHVKTTAATSGPAQAAALGPRGKQMRFINKAVFVASVSLLLSVMSTASTNDLAIRACSNRTLRGDYGSSLSGTVNGLPFAAVNLVSADGNGNITGSGTIVLDGAVIPSTFTATYVVNADCSGSFQSDSGTTENIVISRDGRLVQLIVTGLALGPATVSGTATKLEK